MHIKYLKHWMIGKGQIPLVFLVEMVLSCPITHWRAIFPNSFCVPQLVPTPRAPSAHIWLCTEKRESRVVSPPTCPGLLLVGLHSGAWVGLGRNAIWLPQLMWGLVILYPCGCFEGGTCGRERERREPWDRFPCPCFPVTPDALLVAMAVDSGTPSLPMAGTSRMGKINCSKSLLPPWEPGIMLKLYYYFK